MARYCVHCYTPAADTDTVCKACGEPLRKKESTVPETEVIMGTDANAEDTYVPVDDVPEEAIVNGKDTEQAPVIKMSEWIWSTFLTFIPIVNLVVLIIWGFSDGTNPNKKNYSRAMLIWTVVALIMSIIGVVAFAGILYALIRSGYFNTMVRVYF